MTQNKASWLDDVYAGYDGYKQWSAASESVQERKLMEIEIARAGVPAPARVLDIGFGTGALLLYLQSCGYECWGIERRTDHDSRLNARGIRVLHGTPKQLPAAHFDLVCVMDVFEHLEKAEILDMLRDVRRALKPGGTILARFPNGASPFGAMNQTSDFTHLTSLSISSFSQACSVVGLAFDGGWNSAVSWRAEGLLRSVMKPVLLATRRACEVVIGAVYFGERRPLDMNVTVCAKRPV